MIKLTKQIVYLFFLIFLRIIFFQEGKLFTISNQSSNFTITAVGDIFLGGKTEKMIKKYGYKYPFQKVSSVFQSSDIIFGNLESPLSLKGEPTKNIERVKSGKDYLLRASPEMINSLKYAGFDILSFANNHAMDYGKFALLDTIKLLQKNNIAIIGAGKNFYEANSPKIFNIKGFKIGFVGYSTILPEKSVADTNKAGIARGRGDIRDRLDKNIKLILKKNLTSLREQVDYLIVSCHWGKELVFYPDKLQIELGHYLIENGADLVFGHHPHVIQGIETYKGKLIVYSLGNFVFASVRDITRESFIFQIVLDSCGEIKEIKLIPVFLNKSQPEIATGKKAAEILYRLKTLSERLNTKIIIKEERGIIEGF